MKTWEELSSAEKKTTFDHMASGPGDWDWKYASQYPDMVTMWELAQDVLRDLGDKTTTMWKNKDLAGYRMKISDIVAQDGYGEAAEYLLRVGQ